MAEKDERPLIPPFRLPDNKYSGPSDEDLNRAAEFLQEGIEEKEKKENNRFWIATIMAASSLLISGIALYFTIFGPIHNPETPTTKERLNSQEYAQPKTEVYPDSLTKDTTK